MRVGLTGGIASGKSTVAELLVELGAVLIDGDALAREVVARGTPGLARVVEEFGEDLVTAEGDLDRAALGRIVFADESARRRLEAITHPLIFERYAELEAAAPPGALVVHDIPLLAESGRADTFDAVLVVDVPPEVQVDRVLDLMAWGREHVSLDSPVDEDGDTSLGDLMAQETSPGPDLTVLDVESRERLNTLVEHLDERAADIIRSRYGLTDGRQHKLADIGAKHGISAERVRQLEREALQKLRRIADPDLAA